MGYIRGEAREQTTMFPVTLDELIPADHMCRVIEAFVKRLNMAKLGFERVEPAETGRPGYDPRDLLKLYLWLSAAGAVLAAAGGRMPAQRGSDVVAGAFATGLQIDRRVSADA
jgi:hypothetical protein